MQLDQLVDDMTDSIIKSTQDLIKIKSVKSKAVDGKPFGEGINSALHYMLDLSEQFGFKTKNIDGYIGYAEYGEGSKMIGILLHLDVVPEGDGWSFPPFGGEISDGRIYGRGALDDKGPAVAALYALKAVKDSGIIPDARIRIIFGLDEESGCQCIQHYLENEEAPSFSFVPDANYPVINGEKGRLELTLEKKLSKASKNITISSICGGNRPNMLPDFCEAVLKAHQDYYPKLNETFVDFYEKNQFDMQLDFSSERILIKSFGKSSHASLPENGINAISRLILFLNQLDLEGDFGDFVRFYCKHIGLEYNGASLGCSLKDKESGALTLNVGMINVTPEKASITLDIRYPVTFTGEHVLEKLKENTEPFDISINNIVEMKPLYIASDSKLVSSLMSVYSDFTGHSASPISIGGGTYARWMPNSVAFGPVFPGEPELAHEKDEYISIENLIKNTKIYARAIHKLIK